MITVYVIQSKNGFVRVCVILIWKGKKKKRDSWVRMLDWRNGSALIISDYFNPLHEVNALENHVIFIF